MSLPEPPPTIAEAAVEIKSGNLSPVDLTKNILERIATLDNKYNTYHRVFFDEAKKAAIQAEVDIQTGNYLGPLHGIPIAVKDVFYMREYPTTSNSRVMINWHAGEDATVIERLKQAGAIIIGQLNTFEFTFGGRPTFDAAFPPALNPWDIKRVTGGSSSGSGAAVAAGLCLGALGSDAGGSIRTPAAFCGIAGLKPTMGRISTYGDMPLTYSFDCVGPMAWNSEDCAIMLQALAGYDEKDPTSSKASIPNYYENLKSGVRGIKVGLIEHFYNRDWRAPSDIVHAIEQVSIIFETLGAKVTKVSVSPLMDWHAVGRILLPAEAYAIHEDQLRKHWKDYGSLARGRMMLGSTIRAADYIQAQRRRSELMGEIQHLFKEYDILLTTSMLSHADSLSDKNPFPSLETPMIQVPFNLSLNPAISIRSGFSEDGMPIGAQIIGRHWDEETVLKSAYAIEKELKLQERRPPGTK